MSADLLAAARAARANAYAPYSHFAVGAAVRAASGAIFSGANVENAAYPVGTCAEAGAIAAMVAAGEHTLVEALVVGDGEALVTPCGACRQRLREFGAPTTTRAHCRPGRHQAHNDARGAPARVVWPLKFDSTIEYVDSINLPMRHQNQFMRESALQVFKTLQAKQIAIAQRVGSDASGRR